MAAKSRPGRYVCVPCDQIAPKLTVLSQAAKAVLLDAWVFSKALRVDGELFASQVASGLPAAKLRGALDELVSFGLVSLRTDDGRLLVRVEHYLTFNHSQEEFAGERAADAERKRLAREKKAKLLGGDDV